MSISANSSTSPASYVSQLLGGSSRTPSGNSILAALERATHKSVIPSKQSSAALFGNLGLSTSVLNLLQGGSTGADLLSGLLGGSSLNSDSSSDLIGKATSSLLQNQLSANILRAAQNGAAAKKYAAATQTTKA